MKITVLVENQTKCELMARHGLALYIETKKHRILFDVGPDLTLFENAKQRQIDLSQVDIVIISHGHNDHGGALKRFLKMNTKAKIYVQRQAFEKHYTKVLLWKIPVGLDQRLRSHPQIILLEGDYQIDEELSVFTVSDTQKCYSPANDALYEKNERDTFGHEQNLIIQEHQTVLIMGCGHTGIVNILDKGKKYHPKICIGGFHLYNPVTMKTVPSSVLDEIARELAAYQDVWFCTCHCTGKEAFRALSQTVPGITYLSCGDFIQA